MASPFGRLYHDASLLGDSAHPTAATLKAIDLGLIWMQMHAVLGPMASPSAVLKTLHIATPPPKFARSHLHLFGSVGKWTIQILANEILIRNRAAQQMLLLLGLAWYTQL